MDGYSLPAVCNLAYMTCFAVLGFLAVVMYAITLVLPERRKETDAAAIAAITGTIAILYPSAQVTKIEEES